MRSPREDSVSSRKFLANPVFGLIIRQRLSTRTSPETLMVELTAEGTLELKQFWPQGQSDADTAKVIVTLDGFTLRTLPGGTPRATHVFDGAKVKGKGGTKAVLTAANKLTVRFQGIDAPELHYRAPPLKGGSASAEVRKQYNTLNRDFRQPLGETATVALGEFLAKQGLDDLPCRAVTLV